MREQIMLTVKELPDYEQQRKIQWWGTLQPEGISTLLLKTHVAISHSRYEAGGLVLLEAFHQSVPVLATSNGYAADHVKDWYNGFITEFENISMLCKQMLLFCNQPLLGALLGQGARASAEAIDNEWDFMGTHLYAYGMADGLPKRTPAMHNSTLYDLGKKALDTYPHRAEPMGGIELREQLQAAFGNVSIEITSSTANGNHFVWELEVEGKSYAAVQYCAIMNIRKLWLPDINQPDCFTPSERVLRVCKAAEYGLCHVVFSNPSEGFVVFQNTMDALESDTLLVSKTCVENAECQKEHFFTYMEKNDYGKALQGSLEKAAKVCGEEVFRLATMDENFGSNRPWRILVLPSNPLLDFPERVVWAQEPFADEIADMLGCGTDIHYGKEYSLPGAMLKAEKALYEFFMADS